MIGWDELVKRVAEKGYYQYQADTIITDVFSTIMEILSEGEGVRIMGFGAFRVKEFKNHMIPDPKTRELKEVPTYKVARFTPGKILKESVKAGKLTGKLG